MRVPCFVHVCFVSRKRSDQHANNMLHDTRVGKTHLCGPHLIAELRVGEAVVLTAIAAVAARAGACEGARPIDAHAACDVDVTCMREVVRGSEWASMGVSA